MARLQQEAPSELGRAFIPQKLSKEELPTVEPTPEFRLIHHPSKWVAVAGFDVPLPQLDNVALTPGVNHVSRSGPDMALRIFEAQGATVIPYDAGGLESYIKVVQCARGSAYIHHFESVKPRLSQVYHDPAYWVWCKRLVDDGVIQPPADHIAEMHLAEAQTNLDRWLDLASSQPSAQSGVEAAKHRVRVWETYINPPANPARGKA